MGATAAAEAIGTAPLDRAAVRAIEEAEARAWTDLYAAAPPAFAREAGLGSERVAGALVLRWAATGRRYFSRVVGLGVAEPATPEAIDAILGRYRRAGITKFLLQSLPACLPAGYEHLLRERGLAPFDAQDRVVRGGAPPAVPLAPAADRSIVVERVGPAGADEWAEFLQRVYKLDTGPWLQELIGRPGWSHYVAREHGAIVAARGMYLEPGGIAWLGMDGPVPGLMTQDHEPDAAICAAIVADGLANGARGFITDIEAPSAAMDTPAYHHFARLGFTRPYVRTHWAPRA